MSKREIRVLFFCCERYAKHHVVWPILKCDIQQLDAMKRCAQCREKLGLGVRFRNLWNGRWWVHLRFCSAHCEGLYGLERYEANARHRWYSFLVRGIAS
jgi:hypothetical protein